MSNSIHRHIIDAYELEDVPDLTAPMLAQRAEMSLAEVEARLRGLEQAGFIKRDETGVIVYADNAGYYPDQEEDV